VVLSQHVEAAVAMELLLHLPERIGYLLKERVSDLDEFVATVRRVAEGGTALDPEVVQPLVGSRRNRTALDRLTAPERQLLTLVVEGFSNADIATRLGITERAVRMRVDDVIAKLSVQATPDDRRRVVALLAHLGA
jgi:DNA-binding NarL/FixJ family response regulator